ncbi:hypothetical protein HDV05_005815 [Chytridiales sp. JEL 0842]|nr:hypothetical protein HDV05_005815 [Chytridiales sp. JEL 0842]
MESVGLHVQPTVENLHEAFRHFDARTAWKIYRRLHIPINQTTLDDRSSSQYPSNHEETSYATILHPDDHTTMLNLLTQNPRPALAARQGCVVAFNMRSTPGVHLDVRDYNLLMMLHLRNKDPRKVILTFQALTKGGSFPPMFPGDLPTKPRFHPADVERALKLEEEMSKMRRHVVPDKKSWLLLIAALCAPETLRPWDGYNVYNQMRNLHPFVRWEQDAYSILIEGFGHVKALQAVELLFREYTNEFGLSGTVRDEMFHRSHQRVVEATSRALGACGEAEEAFRMLKLYGKNRATHLGVRGWTDTMYDSAMAVHEANDSLVGGEAVMKRMGYNFDLDWDNLVQEAYAEDEGTYLKYRTDTTNSSQSASSSLFSSNNPKWRQLGSGQPLLSTFMRLMRMNVRAGNHQRVLDIFKLATKMHAPDAECVGIVVEMYLKNGEYEKAKGLYEQMLDEGLMPTVEFDLRDVKDSIEATVDNGHLMSSTVYVPLHTIQPTISGISDQQQHLQQQSGLQGKIGGDHQTNVNSNISNLNNSSSTTYLRAQSAAPTPAASSTSHLIMPELDPTTSQPTGLRYLLGWWTWGYIGDYLTLIATITISQVLDNRPPFERPFDPLDKEISNPNVPNIVTNTQLVLIGLMSPILISAFVSAVRVLYTLRFGQSNRSGPAIRKATVIRQALQEWHTFLIGHLLSLVITNLFTNLTKSWAGRLRPDFLDRCKYDPITRQCTGNPNVIEEGRKSFPSGHASITFSAAAFLSLYLASIFQLWQFHSASPRGAIVPLLSREERLAAATGGGQQGVRRCRRANAYPVTGRAWMLVFALLPFLPAIYVGITRTQQYIHHPTDVIAGAIIGIVAALITHFSRVPNPAPVENEEDPEDD